MRNIYYADKLWGRYKADYIQQADLLVPHMFRDDPVKLRKIEEEKTERQ